jgi:hypothetical protein
MQSFTFLQAAAFQWVNGKAWVIAFGAVTTYTIVDQKLPLHDGGAAGLIDLARSLGVGALR